jgi:hypothetical protein
MARPSNRRRAALEGSLPAWICRRVDGSGVRFSRLAVDAMVLSRLSLVEGIVTKTLAEIKVEQYHYLTPSKKMSCSGFDLSRAFFMPNDQSYLTLGKTSSTFYIEYISAMIKPNISYLSSVL